MEVLSVANIERYLMALRSVNPSLINTTLLSSSIVVDGNGKSDVRV